MDTKINLARIVLDHLSTLKNYRSKKFRLLDYMIFFGTPAVIAGVLTALNLLLNKDIINILVTSLSVFAALLFNLLLLIYSIVQKSSDTSIMNIKAEFLKEIYANISFCILISVISIALLLASFLGLNSRWLLYVLTFINYTLLITFILTLLMILGRVHILLSKEFKAPL